jgi:uncharacterized membrane protein YczE
VGYTLSKASGMRFGTATFLVYLLFIAIEMALVPRGKRAMILLQIPVNFVLTQLIDLWGAVLAFEAQGMAARVLLAMLGVALTGVGSSLSLLPRLVPNPGGGLTQTVSDAAGWELGFAKNVVDLANMLAALFLGALLGNPLLGVGVGTLLAVAGTRRVVALFNRRFKAQILRRCGMDGK